MMYIHILSGCIYIYVWRNSLSNSDFTIHDVWEVSFNTGVENCLVRTFSFFGGLSALVGELHGILRKFEGIEKTMVGQENMFVR